MTSDQITINTYTYRVLALIVHYVFTEAEIFFSVI